MNRPLAKAALSLILCALLLTSAGCKDNAPTDVSSENPVSSTAETASVESVIPDTSATEATIDTAFSGRDSDPSYDAATATQIHLNGGSATVEGGGATAEGATVTVTAAGTYILTGTLTDGQITVRAGELDKVQLVLDNAEITHSAGAAILVESGDKVFLTLAKGSTNTLTDGMEYTATVEETAVDAPLFSKSDLTINGNGTLTLNGNYKHGAVSKDDLRITGGNITVNALSTGLAGKDCVKIAGGTLNITAGTDGIKSDNAEDASRGFVYIKGGTLNITAGTDGIQAETVARIDGGTLNLTTGGGSANASTSGGDAWGFWGGFGGYGGPGGQSYTEDTASAKGIKAGTDLQIAGGSITIDSSDDALHCGADLTIDGGEMNLSSGDDGMHADTNLTVNGGKVKIAKSYEGVEGYTIIVNGGELDVVASDDGFNAAGGNDQSAMGGRPGQNNFTANAESDVYIKITGGKVVMDASGDGVDSNGDVIVTGGEVYVSGPTNSGNGALDYQYSAEISGGKFVAVGAVGMAEGFSSTSTQCSVLLTLSGEAGETVSIADGDGNTLVAFTPTKAYQSAVISCPEMVLNREYTVTAGSGSQSVTLDSVATSYGGGMGGQMGGGQMGGGPGGPGGRPMW